MYSKYGCKRRDPPLPPKAKVLPWIGTTVDYIKAGPSSGERFHKELGPIYRCRIASTAVMDVCLTRNSFGEQSEVHEATLHCCAGRSWLLGEKIVHVADADSVKLLLTCEHDLVQGTIVK